MLQGRYRVGIGGLGGICGNCHLFEYIYDWESIIPISVTRTVLYVYL
jgi:hypothetical protein